MKELQDEKRVFNEKMAAIKDQTSDEAKQLKLDHVPVDFDSYSIVDQGFAGGNKERLAEKERIWRISSLTAAVDQDTRILLLPTPQSRRKVQIQDTNYTLQTNDDLYQRAQAIEKNLEVEVEEVKRFEDKTSEEIDQEVMRKRKKQFAKMVKIRYYQFGFILFAGFFYLFVYRRFLQPKSIQNSVVYHQVVNFAKENPKCIRKLGSDFQIMSCNGKVYPLSSDLKFDLVAFGSNAKGKLIVNAGYNSKDSIWRINSLDLKTINEVTKIV